MPFTIAVGRLLRTVLSSESAVSEGPNISPIRVDKVQIAPERRIFCIPRNGGGTSRLRLAVVAATLPSFLLMSRTGAYPWLRVGGACFAGIAAMGWVVERVLGLNSSVDVVVNGVAHFGVWVACALFAVSLGCWTLRFLPSRETAATAPF